MKYKILQLKSIEKYGFMNYRFAKAHGFKLTDYKPVYLGTIEEEGNSINFVLDDLFRTFNVSRPSDFKGHSMSTSDIVDIDGHKYYCDSIGWVDLETEKNI